MTKAEIDELFDESVSGDYDDDLPWDAVKKLRATGDRYVFERAAEWCNSPEPVKRARGADVLSQLRKPNETEIGSEPVFVDEAYEVLSQVIPDEEDSRVLHSVIFAFGHLRKDDAIPSIISFASHSDEDVRFAVSWALGCFADDIRVVEPLVKLADDADEDVRNWALFGLGTQANFDSAELRGLFVRHLEDPFQEARDEAIAALAKRKDTRAVVPLAKLLRTGSYFNHQEECFEQLIGEHRDDWAVDDLLDALRSRFPELSDSIGETQGRRL